LRLRVLCGAFLIAVLAQATLCVAAAEITPLELPGADAFVYRDASPEAPVERLFVVKPAEWKATDRRAALVFFFGGGWTTGTPASSIYWAKFAADHGMVGIAPDYRTKGRADTSPLAAVADCRAALRWVEEHASELGIDSMHVVVGGNSAGGHLALWTAITAAPSGSNTLESPRIKPAALILFSSNVSARMLARCRPYISSISRCLRSSRFMVTRTNWFLCIRP